MRETFTEWLDAERDEFIDEYLRQHPDATEFEAALMWAATETPEPKENHSANV